MKHRIRWASAGAALALAAAPMALAANPGTGPTTDGGNIFVSINSIGGPVSSPTITGYAGIDRACDTADACGIVVDVSRSTRRPNQQRSNPNEIQDCNGDGYINYRDDANGDGKFGGTLDCEIFGLLNWNNSNQPFAKPDLALVIFGDRGATADVSGNPGQQDFVKPNADDNRNGMSDFSDAVGSLRIEGIRKHTPKTVGGTTKLNEGLRELERVLSQRQGSKREGVFISDGFSQQALDEAVLQRLRAQGIPVDTYAMPGDASVDDQDSTPNGCAPGSHLERIASRTGGRCTEISNSNLLIGALLGRPVQRVDVTIDALPSRQANYDPKTRRWTLQTSQRDLCTATANSPIKAVATGHDGSTATATVGPDDEPLKSWRGQQPDPCPAYAIVANPAILSLLPGSPQPGTGLIPVPPLLEVFLQTSATVYRDTNKNGTVDEGETTPVAGIPVAFHASGPLDPLADGLAPITGARRDPICKATTDANGHASCEVVRSALPPVTTLELGYDATILPSGPSDHAGIINLAGEDIA